MKKIALALCIAGTALSLAACSTANATQDTAGGDSVFQQRQMK